MTGIFHTLAETVPVEVGRPLQAHRDRCLRCQAEDARRRTLARELAALATETSPAPPWLVEAVMADLDKTVRTRHTAALVSGVLAGGATIAAAALAIAVRRRVGPTA